MKKVSIIIPNLNGERLLPMVLNSLLVQTYKEFEVIVVDNGSKDGSISLLKRDYPFVKIIALDKNYGFSYAINRGIEASKGEYISTLNNDMELDPKWLEELVSALESHPDVGSCNPKIMRYFERERINVLGIRYNTNSQVEIIGAGERDIGQYDEMRYIFGVNAGAALYRKNMFEEIGLFDEKLFASFEDVDLSFRAQLAGYKALYVPCALAYHMVGATIKRRKYRPTYLNNRNSVIVFWKNMPYEIIKKNIGRTIWYRTRIFLKRVFLECYKIRSWYFLAGTVAAYLNLPYILKERRKIQSKRKVSIQYLVSVMDKDFLEFPFPLYVSSQAHGDK